MSTPSIQTLITQAQQVLNLKSSNEIRATLAAVLANANVGTPLNPNLTTQQLWDEFYEIVRQPSDDILSIITDQMMRMVFSPPAPGGAGADKQVIFNDGGVLAGDAGLMYNKATDALTITGDLTVRTTGLVVNASGVCIGTTTATPFAGATKAVVGGGSGAIGLTLYGGVANTTGLYFADGIVGNETYRGYLEYSHATDSFAFGTSGANRYTIDSTGIATWLVAGTTAMTLNSTGLGIGVTPANNKFQVAGNIGLPNSCTASGETSGVFSIDVANLLTLTGANWRQTSILIVYSGIDSGASNPTVLQTVVTLTGLATWDTISKNDIVGTASVAVSNDTTTGARITVTVPTGNSGSVYAMLLGGAGTTRPSMTINA